MQPTPIQSQEQAIAELKMRSEALSAIKRLKETELEAVSNLIDRIMESMDELSDVFCHGVVSAYTTLQEAHRTALKYELEQISKDLEQFDQALRRLKSPIYIARIGGLSGPGGDGAVS
jgi:septation ring formation regulator EzrA